ncbi:hypothetical protein GCM10022276_13110 [Sphingomonas limnosediminicola]|uniref:Uncharacterized protein n=1 Tax=Sphingomonas limnosediminicola TaxID=940133 RepID=A0ABP7L5N4_9SPHN
MTQRSIEAPPLEDVLLDFATSEDPLPARLDRFVTLFPSYEHEIRALASEVSQLERTPMPARLQPEEAVMAATHGELLAASFSRVRAEAGTDVLAAVSAPELRKLAKKIDLPVQLLEKLKQRLIDVTTIPSGFVAWLAECMNVAEADLAFSLRQPAPAGVSPHFRLDGASGDTPQSFKDALATSALSDDQRARMEGFLSGSAAD